VTPPEPATFYYDLASPYAYLASVRVDELLGHDVRWRPILVGAVHKHYPRVSWGATPELRNAGIAEIERRAADYGLPPVWPEAYPANSLQVMRAAVWAHLRGMGREFAHTAFAMAFREGVDLTTRAAVLDCALRSGLDSQELAAALDDGALKSALRDVTSAASGILRGRCRRRTSSSRAKPLTPSTDAISVPIWH
jgi:2-hydroxychromene-2-carboxylate isomerase